MRMNLKMDILSNFSFVFALIIQINYSVCTTAFVPLHKLCYWLTSTPDTWYAGNTTCINDGGTPASFQDVTSYVDVVNTLRINGSNEEVWIGVNDLDSEGVWRNYDGSELMLLDFMYDYTTEGSWNGRDALAIIPTENCIWRERRETIDMFKMLCVKNMTGDSEEACRYTVQKTYTTNLLAYFSYSTTHVSASVSSTGNKMSADVNTTVNNIDNSNYSSTSHQTTTSTFNLTMVTASSTLHGSIDTLFLEILSSKYGSSYIILRTASLETMANNFISTTTYNKDIDIHSSQTRSDENWFHASSSANSTYLENAVDIDQLTIISTPVTFFEFEKIEASTNIDKTSLHDIFPTNAVNITRPNSVILTGILEPSLMLVDSKESVTNSPTPSLSATLTNMTLSGIDTTFNIAETLGSFGHSRLFKDTLKLNNTKTSAFVTELSLNGTDVFIETLTSVDIETVNSITETTTLVGPETLYTVPKTSNSNTEILTTIGAESFDFITETSFLHDNEKSSIDIYTAYLTENSFVTYKSTKEELHITSPIFSALSIPLTTECNQLVLETLLMDQVMISTSDSSTRFTENETPTIHNISVASSYKKPTTSFVDKTESLSNMESNDVQTASTLDGGNTQVISTIDASTGFTSTDLTSISKLNTNIFTQSTIRETSRDPLILSTLGNIICNTDDREGQKTSTVIPGTYGHPCLSNN